MIFDLNKKVWQWIILLFLAIIWGSSFILMKKGLEVYSYNIVGALRISIASFVLIPFSIKFFNSVDRKYWKYLFFIGAIGNGMPAFLFAFSQTEVSSSLSGMLNCLTPLFALLIGVLFFKLKPIKYQVIGVIIGIIGASGLIVSNGFNLESSNVYYMLLIIIATICYALSVNVIKSHLKEVNSLAITSLSFLSIGPLAMVYLFTTDFIEVTTTNPFSFLAITYISILSIFGTALAIVLFNMLIKKTSTLFATSVTYLIPLVAIFWGVLDGEKINTIQIISIIITLIGIYFINKFR
jgi:drug/metabolite transporter (DMT)-like permease